MASSVKSFNPQPAAQASMASSHRSFQNAQRPFNEKHIVWMLKPVATTPQRKSAIEPNGLTQSQINAFVSLKPEAKRWHWSTIRRNPSVDVKGRVRHADHATIVLHE
jgi:hypothetical protein